MKLKKSICAAIVISAIAINSAMPITYASELNEYETYTKPISKAFNQTYDIPKEVQEDLSALNNIKYFKLKTNSNYEVALAHSNGSYTFVKEANTIEEAVNIANSLQNEYSEQNIIPTVISNKGIIAYTTNSIGRIVKMGSNISQDSMNYITNLYKDSNKSQAYTYINHGFIDDVPVIEETETMVKIEASGLTGWIEKSDASGANIILLPINQASNLSYYENINGQLIHYISSNVQGNTGTKRSIGRAPYFMNKGTRYYSYDGNYYYNDINKLITDAKADNHNNAVNSNSPYYNYYQYLSARSKVSYNAGDINKYFEAKTPKDSVLRGTGKIFIKAQNKYGVNASYIIGIAMNESSKGTSQLAKTKNNIFGIDAKDKDPQHAKDFASIDDCINKFARDYMTNQYLNPKDWRYYGSSLGNKSFGCNVKYASDPFWGEKASSFMNDMDVYLSSQGRGDDYNRYKLGMLNKVSNVEDKQGTILYKSSKGNSVIVSDDREEYVEINPDRITPLDIDNPIPGSYNWGMKGYITKGDVNIINKQTSNLIVDNIIGKDRYETAAMISDNQNYNTAIIVNADKTLADGLSASGLSGAINGPILLSQKDKLPKDTKERLKGVNKVYIVGDTSSISKSVEDELKLDKIEVIRLGGISRVETSYEVYREIKKINPDIDKVFLVNGYKGEADAMSVSPVANRDSAPIILTNGKTVSLITTILTNNVDSYVIGDNGSMNESIVEKTNSIRLGGRDRFATNKLVIQKFYPNTNEFYISKGYTLVDALTVSPLAENYPVVLAHNGSDKSVVKNATKLIQIGGMDKKIMDECIQATK